MIIDFEKLEYLQTREQIKPSNVIDALRAERLSEYAALSQLIVYEEQSSEKSSVFEAISGVPCSRRRKEYHLGRGICYE